MTEKILACPFCGSDETTSFYFFGEPMVGCGSCNAHGPEAHTFDRAIELWNAAANQLEQLRNGIDEALREAPDENSYSVYLDMVSVFRGEIKQLREKVDLYKDRAEESMRLWTENRSMLQDRIEELFVERDEARRVARVWYNAAGVWKERYEANDVDAISDELMMYCQPRKVTIYPTGTASEVRNDEVKR